MPPNPDSVKSAVRSVLIAQPKGILLSKFVREFQELNGYKIPFQEFGFKTVIEYLSSLKDAVIVFPLTGSKDFMLTGIPDAKNAHVKKLVSGQKCTGNSADARMVKNTLNYFDKMNLDRALNAVNNITNAQVRQQQMVEAKPSPCKGAAKQSGSSQSGSRPKQAGTGRTASQVQQSSQQSQAASQQRTAVQPAAQSRPQMETKPQPEPQSENEYPEPRTVSELRQRVRELLTEFPDGLDARLFADCYLDRFGHPLIPHRFNANSIQELLATSAMSTVVRLKHDPVKSCATVLLRQAPESENNDTDPRLLQYRAKELKKKLVELCDIHRKNGIVLSTLHSEFEKQYRSRIDPDSIGMGGATLEEVLANFSDVVKVEDFSMPSGKGTVVYRVGYRPKWLKPREALIAVPSQAKENLDILLRFYQQHGVYEDKIPLAYNSLFYSDLDWKKYGFPSLTVMVDSLIGEILKKSVDPSGKTVVHFLPYAERDQMYLPIPVEELSQSSVPENVVHPLVPFQPAVFPKELFRGSEVYLTAGEIMSPSNFYFQLVDSNCHCELDDLLDELDVFYQKHDKEYQVPKDQIVAGMLMVGEWEGVWYRGRITHIQDLNSVRVLYYDYGTRDVIPMSGVRYMHEKFHSLPAQAYIGRLAGIVPVDQSGQPTNVWCQEAKNLFLNWFKDRALFGYVSLVEPQESTNTEIIELELYYTHADPDFCINDRLVELGYAKPKVPNPPPPPAEVTVPKPTGPSRYLQQAEQSPSAKPFPDVVPDTREPSSGGATTSAVVLSLLTSPLGRQLNQGQIKYLLSSNFQSLSETEQLQYISNMLQSNAALLQYEAYNQALMQYVTNMTSQMSLHSQPNHHSSLYPGLNISPLAAGSLLGYLPHRSITGGDLIVHTSPDGKRTVESGGGAPGLLMPASSIPDSGVSSSRQEAEQPVSVSKDTSPGLKKIPPPKIKRVRSSGEQEIFVLRFEVDDDVYVPAHCLAQTITTAVSPRALELQLKFKKSKVTPRKLRTNSPELEEVMLALVGRDVPGIFKDDNETVEFYHIYRLGTVVTILDDLGISNTETRAEFTHLMANYSMSSKVWFEPDD